MISLQNISKQYGAKIIFDQASLSIHPTHKIGIIGPNGAGKTLLLRILTRQEEVDKGEVAIPTNLTIAFLPQEMNITRPITVMDLVLEPFSHLLSLEKITEQLALTHTDDQKQYKQMAHAYDELTTHSSIHNIYGLESRAKAILAGLGISQNSFHAPITELSGGFHMRVLLAQLLLVQPDFLLLDEPTNHLDMDSLIWLEKFIQKFNGGIGIISHDREFLNRVTTYTVEINNGKFIQYNGSVSSYLQWKEQQQSQQERTIKNIQSKIDQTEQFITRFKAKNTKASQARSKMKQLDRLRNEIPEYEQGVSELRFRFPPCLASGSIPIKIDAITVAYTSSKPVLSDLSLTIKRGDKVAILGPNGTGKSTLLKACANLISPIKGSITIGHNTTINYYSQHRLEQLDPERNLYETISLWAGTSDKNQIYSILGIFLFTEDDSLKKVKYLSGGEKSRLSLALLLANPGNCLLLDEPTNHLDVSSVERLAAAIKTYDGTLLVVSHDEFFISEIATRIIEMRPGLFRDFPGSLTDYRTYREEGYLDPLDSDGTTSNKTEVINQEKEQRKARHLEKKKLQRTTEKLEKSIEQTEQEISLLEADLQATENAHDYKKLGQTQMNLTAKQKEHHELLALWEEAMNELNALD